MSVLHVVSNPEAACACLSAACARDAVLLVGDGVFAHQFVAEAGVRLGVLDDDIASRGLKPSADVEVLSFGGFVEWVTEFSKTVTWR